MPVNRDKAELNDKLGAWFEKYHPEYLRIVTGEQFHKLLYELIAIGDTLEATKRLEEVSGATVNAALIACLENPKKIINTPPYKRNCPACQRESEAWRWEEGRICPECMSSSNKPLELILIELEATITRLSDILERRENGR